MNAEAAPDTFPADFSVHRWLAEGNGDAAVAETHLRNICRLFIDSLS